MKLYKALKLKKKLSGEVAKLKAQIQSRNSYLIGSKTGERFDIIAAEVLLNNKIKELVDIKLAIYKANMPIQQTIFNLAEVKGLLVFWESVSTHEGKEVNRFSELTNEYQAHLDEDAKEQRIKKIQEQVDSMQEDLDSFNYLTDI